MRAEALHGLLQTMRGETAQKTAGTAGTSELGPFQPSVPTRSNKEFQHFALGNTNDFNDVPTVPTVPTHNVRGKNETAKIEGLASELASERGRNAPAQNDPVRSRKLCEPSADWWSAPVEGWPHSLTIRNLATGKETIIDLRRVPAEGEA